MRAASLLPCLCLALALAGCGAQEAKGTVPDQDAQGRYVIRLTAEDRFEPAEARVPEGAVVAFTVVGPHLHDVDVYAPGSDFSLVSSNEPPPKGFGRLMREGDALNVTLDQSGTWTVWCHTHSHDPGMEPMKARIHVA